MKKEFGRRYLKLENKLARPIHCERILWWICSWLGGRYGLKDVGRSNRSHFNAVGSDMEDVVLYCSFWINVG